MEKDDRWKIVVCKISIRNYRQEDMPGLGELYRAVPAGDDVTFWWVGGEDNWDNVFCAFEDGIMVAKGQVEIMNVMPSGRSQAGKHTIHVNLKTIRGREEDTQLLDAVYRVLLIRARELAESLPREYQSILCVGNPSDAGKNIRYFSQHLGYRPLLSIYNMSCDLTGPPPETMKDDGLEIAFWRMESPEMQQAYLELVTEVWPESPLGIDRLHQYRQLPLWTGIVALEAGTVAGSLMVWEDEGKGIIEEVFVRQPWRRRGIGRSLLVHALTYLKEQGLDTAQLAVSAGNEAALALYRAAGFRTGKEEVRYYIELDRQVQL